MKAVMLHARHLAPAMAAFGVGHATLAECSSKWRIEFDESARSGDSIVLYVIPFGGSPVRIETRIPVGTDEEQLSRLVMDALQAKLGAGYSIGVDD